MDQVKALVLVKNPDLGASLELALLAAGAHVTLCDPALGLSGAPLGPATALVIDAALLGDEPRRAIDELRGASWPGLSVVIGDDGAGLRAALEDLPTVVVLEMPFVGADLIAAIRRHATG